MLLIMANFHFFLNVSAPNYLNYLVSNLILISLYLALYFSMFLSWSVSLPTALLNGINSVFLTDRQPYDIFVWSMFNKKRLNIFFISYLLFFFPLFFQQFSAASSGSPWRPLF